MSLLSTVLLHYVNVYSQCCPFLSSLCNCAFNITYPYPCPTLVPGYVLYMGIFSVQINPIFHANTLSLSLPHVSVQHLFLLLSHDHVHEKPLSLLSPSYYLFMYTIALPLVLSLSVCYSLHLPLFSQSPCLCPSVCL